MSTGKIQSIKKGLALFGKTLTMLKLVYDRNSETNLDYFSGAVSF